MNGACLGPRQLLTSHPTVDGVALKCVPTAFLTRTVEMPKLWFVKTNIWSLTVNQFHTFIYYNNGDILKFKTKRRCSKQFKIFVDGVHTKRPVWFPLRSMDITVILVFANNNDVPVYFHVERGSEIQSQAVTQDTWRDAFCCQVWTNEPWAANMWSVHPVGMLMSGVNRACREKQSLSTAVNILCC